MFYGRESISDRIQYIRGLMTGVVIVPAPTYIHGKNWTDELREKNGYTKLEDDSWATVIDCQEYLNKMEKDMLEVYDNYQDSLRKNNVLQWKNREMEYGLRVAGKALEKSLAITKEMLDE